MCKKKTRKLTTAKISHQRLLFDVKQNQSHVAKPSLSWSCFKINYPPPPSGKTALIRRWYHKDMFQSVLEAILVSSRCAWEVDVFPLPRWGGGKGCSASITAPGPHHLSSKTSWCSRDWATGSLTCDPNPTLTTPDTPERSSSPHSTHTHPENTFNDKPFYL